ncbi:aminotransferase class V-fold PLP-dependent enzyme [Pedobacter cryoconitis]|uniref:Putative pyridoxal-dependent aspartate 1-decarboxylase n=1 Tax=Pedobacter cryoconitis TaxID=188932 RepID=A0A327SCU5_9SPHI|nr:aminotransferase class V-fold PLP-dependent enzyme [Pedobacter cryoconitis]RAJ26896.1 putative pyridoxal-dependent aspartate 1-decarboxylase [Pedobacter cryoconitis]
MEALIHKLRRHHIDVDVVGNQLKLQVPEGLQADEIIQEVKLNKEALIAFIQKARGEAAYSKIPAAPVQQAYVLSSAQQRLYFLKVLDPASLAYNMPQAIRIDENLNSQKVGYVFNKLIARHESLRTSFVMMDEEPAQCIAQGIDFEIEHFIATEKETAGIISKFVRPFDLAQAPLFRIGIIELINEDGSPLAASVLLADMHHIITDGISGDILMNDFRAFYQEKWLPELKLQYKDYAVWQQSKAQQEIIAAQKDFWLQQFKEEVAVLQLPADFQRPLEPLHEGAHLSFNLGPVETAALKNRAETMGVTLFMAVLAVYNILLAKLCNHEDIVIGTPVTGRNHADLEQVIGMFVNTLAIRNKPEGGLSFKEFLTKVKLNTLACFDHQDYQFEELISELKIKRDPVRNPLFDLFFVYENASHSKADNSQSPFQSLSSGHTVAKFDLTLLAIETEDQLLMRFEYLTCLFKKETIERFAGYLKKIFTAVINNIDLPIAEIGIIDLEEKNQLLYGFNNTAFERTGNERISELFAQQVKATPRQTAIHFEGQNISYEELEAKASALTEKIRQNKVPEGTVSAILLDRSVNGVAAILATLKYGCAYLAMDVSYPDDRLSFMLNDSGAAVLLTTSAIMADRQLQWPGKTMLIDLAEGEVIDAAADGLDYTAALMAPPDTLYLIYSSGSTGTPKGVAGSERGLINRLNWGWQQYPYEKGEVCCFKTNLGFVDHVAELFSPLLQGVPLVLLPDNISSNPEMLMNEVISHNISRITLVPSLLQSLLQIKKYRNLHLSALKYFFCSGEILSLQLAKQFCKEFGTAFLVNIYGSSEVGADVTWHQVDRFNVEEVLSYFRHISTADNIAVQAGTDFTSGHVGLGEIAARFTNSKVAEYPVSLTAYYNMLRKDVIPYTINTASPTFIGHMTSVLPDYVHDISKLVSQLNQNLVKVETSKSLTFLEREAIGILHRLFYANPESFYTQYIQQLNANLGIITSGGTTANIAALLCARNRALLAVVKDEQLLKESSIHSLLQAHGYNDMVLLGSKLMHYSFRKAMSIMGLGTSNIILVENDENGVMCADDLQHKIDTCRQKRLLIMAVVGIAGSTERGSIDPLEKIGVIARNNQIHLHVDAAWGGALIFSDAHRSLLKGIEQADSITFCGHKQLYLPQGISVCLFSDPDRLNLTATPASYQAAPNSFDTGRFTIEGSRPALSMCLHASLNIIGRKGYEMLINSNIKKAEVFAAMLRGMPFFELISCQINIINYRYIPAAYRDQTGTLKASAEQNQQINAINRNIQEKQFFQGATFVSKTTISHPVYEEIVVFRVVLSNPLTTHDDLINVLKNQLQIIRENYEEDNDLQVNENILFAEDMFEEEETGRGNKISIGKPLPNTQILITDPYGHLLPAGVSGEICVAGAGLANGYIGHAAATAGSFIKHPYQENARLYKTGDLGKWLPDGNIEFLGRIDSQVKIRGFRIEPVEIEQTLCLHEAVEQAIVTGKGKPGSQYLVAYYVAQESIPVTELKALLMKKLPAYMVPAHYIKLEQVPFTPSGKIDRKLLPEIDGSEVVRIAYEAPHTLLQQNLVRVWEKLLNITGIGINDNFFDLGGHSLSTIRLAAAIKREIDITLPIHIVFQLGTIAGIAQWVELNYGEESDTEEYYDEIKI